MRAALVPVLLLTLVVGGCGEPAAPPAPTPRDATGPGAAPETAAPWRGTGGEIEVTVYDLHCAGCELEIEGDLAAVPGVVGVVADHETDLVKIEIGDAAARAEMVAALREAIHLKEGRLVVGEDPIPAGD